MGINFLQCGAQRGICFKGCFFVIVHIPPHGLAGDGNAIARHAAIRCPGCHAGKAAGLLPSVTMRHPRMIGRCLYQAPRRGDS